MSETPSPNPQRASLPAGAIKRRNRKSLSCFLCKRRKVKCDKQRPCGYCAKHNYDCQYQNEPIRIAITPQKVPDPPRAPQNHTGAKERLQDELKFLKERLSQLEDTYKEGQNPQPDQQATPKAHHLIGNNPIDSPYTQFSFHKFHSPFTFGFNKRKFTGPLGWAALLRVDGALSKVVQFMMRLGQVRQQELFSVDKADRATSIAKSFGHKLKQRERNSVPEELKPLTTIQPQPHDIKDAQVAKSKINERALALGLTFYEGGIDKELALIDKIELVLPKKKVLWKLITRFFSNLYPLLPFLDEDDFRDTIAKYIGRESYDEETVLVKIVRKMDFAYLGTLLVVLRLSYLSLFTNSYDVNQNNFASQDTSQSAQEIRYLLSNPVSIDAIDIADLCLEQFDIMKTLKLPLLQFALFLRIYRVYSPEDGEGSDDTSSSAFTNNIIEMSYVMGLNREVETIPEKELDDEKTNNLCRKIWYYLIILDFNNSLSNGVPLSIATNSYDTKLPYYKVGNENVRDVELELIALRGYLRIPSIVGIVEDILNVIAEVKNYFPLPDLTHKLDKFELENLTTYKKLYTNYSYTPVNNDADYRAFESNFFKIKLGMIYCFLNTFLINIYIHLYNFYETKGHVELSFFYMKKSLFIAIHEIMPIYTEVLRRGPDLFHRSTDLVITPKLETTIHRTLILIQGLVVRARFSTYYMKLEPLAMSSKRKEHYDGLLRLIDAGNGVLKLLLEVISKISDRYYFAWRLYKVGRFLYQIINEDKLYDALKDKQQPLKLTPAMVDELTSIISDGVKLVPMSPPNVGGKLQAESFLQPTYGVISDHRMNNINTPNEVPVDPFPASITNKSQDIDDLWMQMISVKQSPFSGPGFESVFNELGPNNDSLPVPDILPEKFEFDLLAIDELIKSNITY